MKTQIRLTNISKYEIRYLICYICEGQKRGYCDYRIQYIADMDSNVYTEKFFHTQCLAENIVAMITADEERDKHSDEQMKRQYGETRIHGLFAPEAENLKTEIPIIIERIENDAENF